MPPKKAKGKGKKVDDDEAWEKSAAAKAALSPPAIPTNDEEDDAPFGGGKRRGGFAGLSLEEPTMVEAADENEDFGGLMSAIKSSTTVKPKKEKKKKKKWDDYDEELEAAGDAPPADGETPAPAPVAAQEMTAEELADLEFGPGKDKKKGKKGGKKGKAAKEEDEEPQTAEAGETAEVAPLPAAGTPALDSDEEQEGKKPLSKKEKDKLKKEREKEKKRLETVSKKAAEPTGAITPTTPATPAEGADQDAGTGKMSKAQKKKLKNALGAAGGTIDEPPKAAEKKAEPTGKNAKRVAALREAMEAQRLAQEEAARKAEEERLRLEAEEKRKEEEEKRREEEKQLRKEQEKAKREQLKKEGKLLTPKQKKAQAAAELRKQALLANPNIAIAALQEARPPASPSSGAPAKVKYGSRARPARPAAASAAGSSSRPESPAPARSEAAPSPTPSAVVASPKPAEKESWEDSDEEPPKPAAAAPSAPGVKDDWDASSEEETPAEKPAPTPAPVTKAPPTKGAPTAKPAASSSKTPVPVKGGKPTAEEPESEEDEEESEEESDDDDSDDDSEEDSSDEELTAAQRDVERRKAEAAARKTKRIQEAMAARSKDDLRSPICCILGHVDTGKTKLLDKIRQTNVQEGEAGGITQQIGATYFPVDAIREKTKVVNPNSDTEIKIPGLLIIDTPGHESFTNLRSRGSSLCNIAVLVVDIMHGLEPQTLESLRLLREKKTPFIVALNKIDRMYGWDATPNNGFRDSLSKQRAGVTKEFEKRLQDTILAFAEQGLNAKLFYENDAPGRIVSLVPTSAITGEGIPDMIMLLVNLTQQRMSDKLMYLSEVECTVLEVKVIEGLGTTIDVVLSNGYLREGDKIVLCGLNGPIVTQIRALLTPQPLRELRIKSAYVHHKEVKAALGVKITAPDLEKAIAGSRLLVCTADDDEDDLREEVMSDLTSLLNFIDKSGRGVCVQASTLGSLEALLDFLKSSKIPVSGINIGPVHKKDIMRSSTMLEKARELACILCFDVTVDREAEALAKEMGIRLFKADIIYHLFDSFMAYHKEIEEAKRKDAAPQAIWPCRLKIIACFAKRDPIILGVDILDGALRVGTPLCVVKTDAVTGKKDIIRLGKISSLEINHKAMDIVKKSQAGAGVAVKIEHAVYESAKMYGRHFDDKDEPISMLTRQSIDVLKESFRKDVSPEEWGLIKQLKPRLGIP